MDEDQQNAAPTGSQKQQLVERLKSATNILVTVRNNPTVDQLSACIGLTIMLNKLDKHATAVFSGDVPSTIEFLKPEETLEKNTDSLRDFIIALDKSKADKLRYKVEDKVVKIFITPYKTSITDKDLDFSQGDFNVDAVVALGAHEQNDLDQAIVSHGRILHDATVMSINNTQDGNLGTINWQESNASSLSELVAELTKEFDKKVLDEQIATALLTGIVAETERFSNEKTSPETMSIAAQLMSAGANQQLVATKLEEPVAEAEKPADDQKPSDEPPKPDDGTLEIEHEASKEPPKDEKPADQPSKNDKPADKKPAEEPKEEAPAVELPAPVEPVANPEPNDVITPATDNTVLPPLPPLPTPEELPHIRQLHDEPRLPNTPAPLTEVTGNDDNKGFVSEPPAMGGMLTANTEEEGLDPAVDPFAMPTEEPQTTPILHRDEPNNPQPPHSAAPVVAPPPQEPTPAPQTPAAPAAEPPELAEHEPAGPTLSDIEHSVHSPHVDQAPAEDDGVGDVDTARDEVLRALSEGPDQPLPPISALNAQPLGEELHPDAQPSANLDMPQVHVDDDGNLHLPSVPPTDAPNEPAPASLSPSDQPMTMPLPPAGTLPPAQPSGPAFQPPSPTMPAADAPPPVPPPMMPPPAQP